MVDGVTRAWPSDAHLQRILWEAALHGQATPLDSRVISLPMPGLSNRWSPPGGTAWVGLDESHITLHWYHDRPNEGQTLFALDVFTCGERASVMAIVDEVMLKLGAEVLKQSGRERFA